MPTIIDSDPLFRYLVKFHVVENFYKRALRASTRDGDENHKLVAPLIIRDLPTIRGFVKQELKLRQLDGLDLRQVLIEEANQDGAYVLEKKMLSNKVYVHNLVQSVLRDNALRTLENLQKRGLPSDYSKGGIIGTKTQNALAAGLRGGRAYLVKQTAFGRTSCGKVCLFDHTGLRAEFFLVQDFDKRHPSSHYFHPSKRIIGVLNESPTLNNDERTTTLITPLQLGISPGRYLNLGEKLFSNVSDLFKIVQLGV
ncbi:hypothetical protein HY493_04625 [Candidatus Woesearchaeota archaeon]|nr:hypothetical protein [Candidatus Woesearchaeota archaeon]